MVLSSIACRTLGPCRCLGIRAGSQAGLLTLAPPLPPPPPPPQVVGSTSSWVDCDSDDPALKAASSSCLKHELGWAAHLGLQAVLLPPPPRPMGAANFARLIHQVRSRV